MELEDILKNYIEAKNLLETSDLLLEAGLVSVNEKKDFKAADALLAKTTKADADLLAKTTKADAEILAQATEIAASELRRSNEKSLRWMTIMTMAMLAVGFIQIMVAALAFLKK